MKMVCLIAVIVFGTAAPTLAHSPPGPSPGSLSGEIHPNNPRTGAVGEGPMVQGRGRGGGVYPVETMGTAMSWRLTMLRSAAIAGRSIATIIAPGATCNPISADQKHNAQS